MHLYSGSVARIDLAGGDVELEPFAHYRDQVGGRGVNQHILFRETPRGGGPFEPGTLLALGAGLLAGTDASGACRLSADSLNALTGGIGSGNCGGFFASELRAAGVPHLILRGRAPTLSYLLVENGAFRILDAEELRGVSTLETDRLLAERHGGAKVLCIGQAGEKRVHSACLIADGARAVGRCGLGAVMGAKNLKAVVVKGSGARPEPEDAAAFRRICEVINARLAANPFNQKRMKYGVYCYPPWEIESPFRNFSAALAPEASKQSLHPDNFLRYKVGEKSCPGCPIRCWAVHEVQDESVRQRVEAFQGNDPHDFGAKLDMSEPADVLRAHALCTELGLDVDNASGVIAWAIDCFQRGLLDENDTGGLTLRWGEPALVFRLLEDLAARRGLGDLLAEGSALAARKVGRGTERFAVHVKGQELMECLWMSPSWALGVMVSPRGGGHTRGAVLEGRFENLDPKTCRRYFGVPDIGGPGGYEHKEKLVVFFERLEAFLDSIGLCMFTNSLRLDMVPPEEYARLYGTAVGREAGLEELLRLGERIHTMEKCFNVLHTSWGRAEDMPPALFTERPLDGKYGIDRQAWSALLDRYYALHGWDAEGRPRRETLIALGLEEAAASLQGVCR
jgi:aldehyde:ferredoxin oxidoreductase